MQLGGYAITDLSRWYFPFFFSSRTSVNCPFPIFNYFQARQSLRIVQFYITFRPMENLFVALPHQRKEDIFQFAGRFPCFGKDMGGISDAVGMPVLLRIS